MELLASALATGGGFGGAAAAAAIFLRRLRGMMRALARA